MTDTSQPGPAERLLMEKGWTQRAFARHINGNSIGYNSKNAVCFCVIGAILAAYKNEDDAIKKLSNFLVIDIAAWNDDPARTKEEVCAALRTAGNL